MKTPFIIICFLMMTSLVNAQTQQIKQVEAAVETLRKALISADKPTLEKIASDKLSYGHSSGKIQDKKEFIRVLVDKESVFTKIDLTDQTIEIAGKNAIVRHKFYADTADGGVVGKTALGVLLVWVQEGNQWKLLARQAYKI